MSVQSQSKFDDNKLKKLHKGLKSGVPKTVTAEIIKKSGLNPVQFNALIAIAKQTTDVEFVNCVKSHALPAVKLTPEQMEAMQGGTTLACITASIAISGLLYDMLEGIIDSIHSV